MTQPANFGDIQPGNFFGHGFFQYRKLAGNDTFYRGGNNSMRISEKNELVYFKDDEPVFPLEEEDIIRD